MAFTFLVLSLPIVTLFAFIADMPKVGAMLTFVTFVVFFLLLG